MSSDIHTGAMDTPSNDAADTVQGCMIYGHGAIASVWTGQTA